MTLNYAAKKILGHSIRVGLISLTEKNVGVVVRVTDLERGQHYQRSDLLRCDEETFLTPSGKRVRKLFPQGRVKGDSHKIARLFLGELDIQIGSHGATLMRGSEKYMVLNETSIPPEQKRGTIEHWGNTMTHDGVREIRKNRTKWLKIDLLDNPENL